MASTIYETDATREIATVPPVAVEKTDISDPMRIARYCALEECLGLIFGIMTAGYIVSSLAGLRP
jgi:hypothetical protein